MKDSIKEIVFNTIKLVVAYLKEEHDDKLDDDRLMALMTGIESVVKNERGMKAVWSDNRANGKELGYSYVAHYAMNLFKELITRRFDAKHHLGLANKLAARYLKKRKATTRSQALTMALPRAKSRSYIKGESISQELRTFIEAEKMGLYEQVVDSYPSLRVNRLGEPGSYPAKREVMRAVRLCIILSEATGYK